MLFHHTSTVECRSCVVYAQDNNTLPVWIICHQLTYLYLHQFSTISGGNCIKDELHDEFLATLTRDNYLKFRHMHSQSFSASSPSHHDPSKLKTSFSGESKHQTPSESQTALNNYKKGPQRKAFFSQQEEISDDDEYANAEEQFSRSRTRGTFSIFSFSAIISPQDATKVFPPSQHLGNTF